MPANIAHILIAHTAYQSFRDKRSDIFDAIMSKNNLFYLGSLGPDLPSYKTSEIIKKAFEQLLLRPFIDETNPQEKDASFFLHSTRANLFPFYLLETNLTYSDIKNGKIELNDFNYAVYAFTLGYVTHIAADQVIHRLVRELVGPYYRSLAVSQKHSECEVYQDVFLLSKLKGKTNLNKVLPSELINVEKLGFDLESFCNMYSLAISKAGYNYINKDYIESWIEGMNFAFDKMDDLGPIATALKYYDKNKNNVETSEYYLKYFKNEKIGLDYMKYFDKAVLLSVKYMNEIARLWKDMNFSYDNLIQYQKVISSEDLTSPLNEII